MLMGSDDEEELRAALAHLKASNEEAEATTAHVRKLHEQAAECKVNAIHAEMQGEPLPKTSGAWDDAAEVPQQLKAILQRHSDIYQRLTPEALSILSRFQGEIHDETENREIPGTPVSNAEFLAHKFSCSSYVPISVFSRKARSVSVTVLEDRVEASRSLPGREAATLLASIAIARGFQSVTLSGSITFQHHAERILRKAGIKVKVLGATETSTPEKMPGSVPGPSA